MIKFKITPERCSEVLSIVDYLAIGAGSLDAAIRVAPRFVLDEQGEYMVRPVLDEDGDLKELEGIGAAVLRLSSVTPKRSERLARELTEAVRAIVDPTRGRGLKKPSSTEPEPPLPGS